MIKRVFSVCLISIAVASSAVAQVNSCNALLDHGISNIRTQTSEYNFYSAIKSEYCQTNYESMSNEKKGSFSAVVKSIPISLGGNANSDQQKHQNFCQKFNGEQNIANTEFVNTVTIQNRALDAWNQCQRLLAKGLTVTPIINDAKTTADFTLLFTGGAGSVALSGADTINMSCKVGDNTLGSSSNLRVNQTATSIRCVRKSNNMVLNNSNVIYYPDANVKIKTGEGDYFIEFADQVNFPARDQFEALRTDIANLRNSLNESQQMLRASGPVVGTAAQVATNPGGWSEVVSCPAGSYATGIAVQDRDTGTKCMPCISGVRLTCSAIPTAARP